MARAEGKVVVATEFGGDFIGIMAEDLEDAADSSEVGVLVVGPPEIAAKLANEFPGAVVFALKDVGMELSPQLAEAQRKGQLHRLNVDIFKPNAWSEVHEIMLSRLGLPSSNFPF